MTGLRNNIAWCLFAVTLLSFSVSADEPRTPLSITAAPESIKVLAALQRPVSFDFNETPLNDVVAFLKDFIGINVLLDTNGLELASIDPDQPVTLRLDDIPVSLALDLLLEPLNLTYVVRGDVLVLTDIDQTANKPETRVYPVVDIVQMGAGPGESAWLDEEYIELIQTTLDPSTWEVNGGTSSITFAPATASFVVSAGQPTHRKLVELLTQLRKSKTQAQAIAKDTGLPTLEALQTQIADEIRERREAKREAQRKPTAQERREKAETEEAEARAELAKLELQKAKGDLQRPKADKKPEGDDKESDGKDKP